MIFKRFKMDTLCEHITDGEHGSVSNDENGEYFLLSNKNIKNGKIIYDQLDRKINLECFKKINKRTRLGKNDVVIATVGTIGKTAIIKADNLNFDFQRSVGIFKTKKTLLKPEYLHYYLQIPSVQKRLKYLSTGAVQKCLFISDLKNIDIDLPTDFLYQTKISNVLSDIDAKIELNNKINKELEAMAKLIYEYWFVQFDFPDENGKPYKSSGGKMEYNKELKREIPKGWEVNLLGDLGNFKNGVNYDPSNPGEIACPIINVRNISASSYFLKNEDLDIIYLNETDVQKYSVHENSIIIARSGIPGATRLIADFQKNTLYCGFAIHYQLENTTIKLPVFFYLKSIEHIIKEGSGGTILKNVNQATLNGLKIALPSSESIIESFNKKISPMFKKINLIQNENQKLAELRDWLLPILMNGQVTVK